MKTPIKYLLTIDACMYCQTVKRDVDVSVEEYEAHKAKYDCGLHECSSERGYPSDNIHGGGPCCDPLGHKITPVYQD